MTVLFKRAAAVIAATFLSAQATAFEIQDIRIAGLKRVSAERILSTLPVQAGDEYTQAIGAQTIRDLFELGFFKSVELSREGDVLLVELQERPAIARILIEGNDLIPDEAIRDVMDGLGLREGEVINQSALDNLAKSLQREYENQGRYDARVESRQVELPDNRVGIEVQVAEGAIARIGQIQFFGNAAFERDELTDEMELKERGFWTFFTKSDRYNQQKLRGDVERLRSLYLNNGYAQVEIDTPSVQFDPSTSKVYLALRIQEGPKYQIGEVKIAGNLPDTIVGLEQAITVKPGDTFTRTGLTDDVEALQDIMGNSGYTQAQVQEIPEFDPEAKQVDITYLITPELQTYVRRIDFKGNLVTTDSVLRRSMVQMEGALADTSKVERSRRRLQQLGYFARVTPRFKPVPGSPDQVDLEMEIEEQATGSFSASVGYSQSSGAVFGVSLSQDNFLGTGNNVSVSVNKSDSVTQLNFSFFDPFYTVDGVSRSINAFFSETDFKEQGSTSYQLDETGFSLGFGYPIDENQRVGFTAGIRQTDLTVGTSNTVQQIQDFSADVDDETSFLELEASTFWQRSTLNRGRFATSGSFQRVDLGLSAPGSDLTYYTLGYRGEKFFEMGEESAIRIRSRLAYGDGYGDLEKMPFFRNYFAGGERSVRGFKANSLGPKSVGGSKVEPFGGNALIIGGVDYQMAAPFLDDPRSNRLSAFLDVGQVYDTENDIELDDLRASVGVGFTWMTAIGPLTFSWAEPIQSETGDKTETFQFSIGTGL